MKASDTFSHAGVRYRFVRWGEAAAFRVADVCASRPFVLLHGFAQSARSWDDIAARLAPRRLVYAFDFVGHGKSERPRDPAAYGMDAACGALLAFLQHVQDENAGCAPCVVGYSMGGRMALAAAARALPSGLPFGALVLESAGLGPASPAEREEAARRNGENARRLREDGVAAFMDAWERLPLFATQRGLPSGVRACVREQRLDNDAEALARTFEGTGAHRMPCRAETLAALRELQARGIPVCYVAGERDAKYRALAEQLAAQVTASVRAVAGTQAVPPARVVAGTQAVPATRATSGVQGAVGTRSAPSAQATPGVQAAVGTRSAPPAQAASASRATSRLLTVRVVPQAGHNVHLERPAAFVRVLEEFSHA